MTTSIPDISLLYTRPTNRRSNRPDMVDLLLPSPGNGSYGIANYVRAEHANAIIDAINQRDQLLDLLADLVGDFPAGIDSNALAAARAYLGHHPPPEPIHLRTEEALSEIARLHRVRNDVDAYLLALVRWGLGQIEERPNLTDYGLPPF